MTNKYKMNEDVLPSIFNNEVVINCETVISKTYRVFIDDTIGEGTTYRSLISILYNASEDDTIIMHISSPGGSMYTAMQIYMAMLNTQAHTIAIVDGYAASAATFFVMAAKQVLMSPHSHLMLHNASYGSFSDMAGLKSDVDFHYQQCLNLVKDMYRGFMTDEEIEDMVENHKDINMDANEVLSRLEKREAMREMEYQEYFKENDVVQEEPQPPAKKAPKKRATKKTIKE